MIVNDPTFVCDGCDKEYMLSGLDFEIPPHWIACHVAIGNKDGFFPDHELNDATHFCSIECIVDYFKSREFGERYLTVDRVDNNGTVDDV